MSITAIFPALITSAPPLTLRLFVPPWSLPIPSPFLAFIFTYASSFIVVVPTILLQIPLVSPVIFTAALSSIVIFFHTHMPLLLPVTFKAPLPLMVKDGPTSLPPVVPTIPEPTVFTIVLLLFPASIIVKSRSLKPPDSFSQRIPLSLLLTLSPLSVKVPFIASNSALAPVSVLLASPTAPLTPL